MASVFYKSENEITAMETLLLLIITTTAIIGSYFLVKIIRSYFLVNLTTSLFTKEEGSNSSMSYGNYNKKRQQNQAYSNFQKRIIKKTTELRTSRS